jgi:hypothetical protein
MMGVWPPLIKNQEMEILETKRREDFTQCRIRFYWTPDEKAEGYLLIPDGNGEKPAVITVYCGPGTAVGFGDPNLDFAYQLTKREFVTLSIGQTDTLKATTSVNFMRLWRHVRFLFRVVLKIHQNAGFL